MNDHDTLRLAPRGKPRGRQPQPTPAPAYDYARRDRGLAIITMLVVITLVAAFG